MEQPSSRAPSRTLVSHTTQPVAWVYFAQDAMGRIKIGYSSDPRRRLAALRGANPTIVGIVRAIDGGRPTERWLHRRFAAKRITGEWFSFDPEMLTVVPPDEIPVTKTSIVEEIQPLGYQPRLREVEALGLMKPGSEGAALQLIVSLLSDEERAALLEWMRSQP